MANSFDADVSYDTNFENNFSSFFGETTKSAPPLSSAATPATAPAGKRIPRLGRRLEATLRPRSGEELVKWANEELHLPPEPDYPDETPPAGATYLTSEDYLTGNWTFESRTEH